MTAREATRFLLWFGEKTKHGHPPTEEELLMFEDATEVSKAMAEKYMFLREQDWRYVPGEAFK